MSNITKLGKKTKYNYDKPDPALLETFENKNKDTLQLVPFIQSRDEFTSLCPVTGQPDYAKFEIIYIPDKLCVESKSLKLYLMSFRNHGEFHEDVTARILKDLVKLLSPHYIRVIGDFASRGGLAIKPVAVRYGKEFLENDRSKAICRDIVKSWDIRQDLR